VKGKEKGTVRAKPTLMGIPFRYGAGRTGNGRVFARSNGKSDGVVNSSGRTHQDTSLATRNI
jgi:hypothetical protein